MDLIVRVDAFRDLKSLKVLRSITNPYVLIKSGLHTKRSEAHGKGRLQPHWNIEATFMNVNEHRYPMILFEVYDEGKWGLGDMLVGKTSLPIPLPTTFFEGWLNLNNGNNITGQIHVHCDCLAKVDESNCLVNSPSYLNCSESRCSFVSTNTSIFDSQLRFARGLAIPVVESNDLQFVRNIGRGAQEKVDLHIFQNKRVAVKTFYYVNANANERPSSFLKEVENLYYLQFDYFVRLLGVSDAVSTEPKIVMEYMDRGNLRQYLEGKKCELMIYNSQYDLNSMLFIAIAIADGLKCLHEQHIVYQKLTPFNVLINSTNEVKLADFGITREYANGNSAMAIKAETCLWMAPEVYQTNDCSIKADIYSFGLILTELETLEQPYHDAKGSDFVIQNLICQGRLRPTLSNNCPVWYRALAAQCMAADPVNRPTADEVGETLRQHLSK